MILANIVETLVRFSFQVI